MLSIVKDIIMINKLDKEQRKYSHKYFVKEFMKSKPNAEYHKLKYKCVCMIALICLLIVSLVISVIRESHLSILGYWFYFGISIFLLVVCVFVFWKLECQRMMVLSGMASAYLEKYKDLKKNTDLWSIDHMEWQNAIYLFYQKYL